MRKEDNRFIALTLSIFLLAAIVTATQYRRIVGQVRVSSTINNSIGIEAGNCPIPVHAGMYLPSIAINVCADISTQGNFEPIDGTGRVDAQILHSSMRMKGQLKGPLPHGTWIWYPNPDRIEMQISFLNGKLDGKFQYLHPEGDFAIVGNFKDNLPDGVWTYQLKSEGYTQRCVVNFSGNQTVIDQACMNAMRPYLFPHPRRFSKSSTSHDKTNI